MKKAKNRVVTESEINNEKNAANPAPKKASADRLRAKDSADGTLTFKKTLYGFDPDEVGSYIEELNKTYIAAARTHEEKLSAIKEELLLSNRERDSYGEKYRECKSTLDKLMQAKDEPEPKDNTAEYEAAIASLEAKLKNAELENKELRIELEQSRLQNKAPDAAADIISKLREENRILASERELLVQKNEDKAQIAQKYDSLFGDYNAILAQLEFSKADVAAMQNELKASKEKLKEKENQIRILSDELENEKKKSAEIEIENSVISQQLEEKEQEIGALKEQNKAQAYEFADKVNRLESDYAKSKLDFQKEIKLHDYYISQAAITLTELSKQIEQIKSSFSDAQF